MSQPAPTGLVNVGSDAERMNPQARRFLTRLTIVTAGGMFIDGYIFAVIGVTLALQTFRTELGVDDLWLGLISSATLIGIFIGGFLFGWLTDRYGRRPLFIADLACFVVAAVLMFFVQEPWQMFVLAVILGLAVGADYAIGTPLLSEFAPRTVRGRLGSSLQIAWNVGYMIAFLIGFLITVSHPDAWRWVLVSAAVPAILCLIARHGLPESPRWLLSKGRVEEAREVLNRLGWKLEHGDFEREQSEHTSIRALFRPGQLGRTVFVCAFWMALVLPYFAIIFFQAGVYESLRIENPILTALLGTVVVVVGVLLGTLLIDRVGRRKLLIIPFWVMSAALVLVIFERALPGPVIIACFFVYLFAYGVASVLCGVYPMELFPTSIRTTGVGFATSMTRVGSAVGTFLFPQLLAWNAPVAIGIMAVICVIGAIVSQLFAPETANRTLTDVASAKLGRTAR
ncbi:MFS transporter [Microbacterium oxydans]|uniref:MFS transporter n=1 Tax=Microbacterium oxydans TaxID=82380 RepID=UPI00226B5836|nr:MFS transporter [Microbacterium oxydans]WAA66066.1 sugar porter family MFS transporter [Microbacterium oxydans]